MTYQKKAYLSTITVTNIYQSFYLQDGGNFFSIYADTVNLLVFFAGLCRLFAISILFEILLYLSAFSRTLKILYL